MDKFLIIADDFTGANDTGVQLRKRGMKTDVVFEFTSIQEKEKEKCYVIDTESRGLSPEEAYKIVELKIKDAFENEFNYVYKKVDSTLRGNIASEIKAVDKYYNADFIIFAPAYPDSKRTTLDGIQKINKIPITETEIAKDPMKPVQIDNINLLLKGEFEEEVTHVYLKEIRENTMDLSKGRIFTFDSETNEDLMSIVREIISHSKKVLWVGSAGLADSILKVKMPTKPSIAVIGSISEVSRKQLHYAKSKGINIINVDIESILKSKNTVKIVEDALEKINKGLDVIIASTYERDDYERAIKTGESLGYSREDVSIFTQNVLGEITQKIMKQSKISGLFLTGGDTAIGVIKKLGVSGASIKQELMTGIPLMTLYGGENQGLNVITKAGAFGEENAIEYCMKKLKEGI
ncbi:MAG: four-carbon acid sugar kinase family protein [Clostridium sp.]